MLEECSRRNRCHGIPTPKKNPKVFAISLSGFKTVVNHTHMKKSKHIWLFLKHIFELIFELCLNLPYLCDESYVTKLIIPRILA